MHPTSSLQLQHTSVNQHLLPTEIRGYTEGIVFFIPQIGDDSSRTRLWHSIKPRPTPALYVTLVTPPLAQKSSQKTTLCSDEA